MFAENTNAYLFTTADMEKARNRAIKNPEDVYPVEFTEPEPEIIVKEVIKDIEVETPGFFKRIWYKLTGK